MDNVVLALLAIVGSVSGLMSWMYVAPYWGYLIIIPFGWAVALYWLPTLISHERDNHLHTWVAVINLFGGWMLGMGWVLAMVIALAGRSRHAPAQRA